MQFLCFLGRQPALSLAELESRFGAECIEPLGGDLALLEAGKAPDFDNLGSVFKAAQVLDILPSSNWQKAARYIEQNLPEMPDGKVTLGLSVRGVKIPLRHINAFALSLKKHYKTAGHSVRVVPNKESELSTPQILHNKLTQPNGLEFNAIASHGKTLIARTVWIQDIDAYAKRDHGRPARDTKVGMLPPKLAQIIISLAVGRRQLSNQEIHVLDPFCGTGVVLQEALLQGYFAVGTDLEPRMVDYTLKNLTWLHNTVGYSGTLLNVDVADATSTEWVSPFDTIAGETYLGRPFSAEPDRETLTKVIHDVNTIHKKFLQNVVKHPNVDSLHRAGREFRICIAVPAWHTKSGVKHLPVLDHLKELGYNRVSFVHAKQSDLIYHREGQIVGRELVVLTRT